MSELSSRRALLRGLLLAPLASATAAEAKDYASAAEALEDIDRLEEDVAARLEAIAAAQPGARAFVESVRADQRRHRAARNAIRRRLGLALSPTPRGPAERDLGALRTAQEALTHAVAETLPALKDARAVDTLARHMVDLSRHLTVIDLWIEQEAPRE